MDLGSETKIMANQLTGSGSKDLKVNGMLKF